MDEETGFRSRFWAKFSSTMTILDNATVRDDKTCPFERFNDGMEPKNWGKLRVFVAGIWIESSRKHVSFMNLRNKAVIHSRDCTWLNVTLGEFRKNEKE